MPDHMQFSLLFLCNKDFEIYKAMDWYRDFCWVILITDILFIKLLWFKEKLSEMR